MRSVEMTGSSLPVDSFVRHEENLVAENFVTDRTGDGFVPLVHVRMGPDGTTVD